MTAAFLDEELDVETPPANDQSGSQLRKFAKDQQQMVKDLQKQVQELTTQLSSRTAADVFQKLGVPDKVRKFYSGDVTEDAITQWVKDNADVFGLAGTDGGDPTVPPERQQLFDDLSGVTSAESMGVDKDGSVSRDVLAQQRAELLAKPRGSRISELDAALASMGVPNTPIMAPQF